MFAGTCKERKAVLVAGSEVQRLLRSGFVGVTCRSDSLSDVFICLDEKSNSATFRRLSV
jgi:hypothetical protein